MKKLITIIFTVSLIAIGLNATSSKAPDMERIKTETTNPDSKYYYPALMERYERNETIMTAEDYRYLYYGYMFQEDYNPYRHSEYENIVQDLYYQASHTRAECDSIIEYAELSLKDNPFDLRQMSYLIYALRTLKKTHRANIWQYRLNHIIEAIVSSGTGLDAENAWYVINPKHEYDILNFSGLVAESQQYMEPYYDCITVKPRSEADTATTYYFNIRHLLEEYYRKFPEE